MYVRIYIGTYIYNICTHVLVYVTYSYICTFMHLCMTCVYIHIGIYVFI